MPGTCGTGSGREAPLLSATSALADAVVAAAVDVRLLGHLGLLVLADGFAIQVLVPPDGAARALLGLDVRAVRLQLVDEFGDVRTVVRATEDAEKEGHRLPR